MGIWVGRKSIILQKAPIAPIRQILIIPGGVSLSSEVMME